MGVAIAFPILFILLSLQTTIFSQITLLSGSIDLVLIWLSAWTIQGRVKSSWFWMILAGISAAFVTAMPWIVIILSYAGTTFLSRQIIKRVWQSPLLMMFVVTIFGSILLYSLSYFAMTINGANIPWKTALINVVIPSILLNVLFAIPVYAIAKDTAQWVYPSEVNE